MSAWNTQYSQKRLNTITIRVSLVDRIKYYG